MVIFRQLTKEDQPLLADAIDNDAFHSGWLLTEFFYNPESLSVVLSDEIGPVLVVRMKPSVDHTVKIFIQFTQQDRIRTARVLREGFPTFRETLRKAGFTRIVFDSESPKLIRFVKQFGFQKIPNVAHHYALSL